MGNTNLREPLLNLGDSQISENMTLWREVWEDVEMGSAIALPDDFGGVGLRLLALKTKHTNQSRRLLALAEIYDGIRSRRPRGASTGTGNGSFLARSLRVRLSPGSRRSKAAGQQLKVSAVCGFQLPISVFRDGGTEFDVHEA